MKIGFSIAAGLVLLSASSLFAGAPEIEPAAAVAVPVEQVSEWQYSVTPFLWATAMGGSVGNGVVSADIDLSFSDILENLDLAMMLDFRARNGDWEFGGNLVYADLSASSGDIVQRRIGAKTTIIEADVKYYYNENVFAFGGGRYYDIGTTFSVGPASAAASFTWVDPIIGGGFAVPLSEKWSVVGKADIGGFGIGSDFAWQAQGYFQYQSSDKISFLMGYRHLDFDYSSGATQLSLVFTGPVLGLRIKF